MLSCRSVESGIWVARNKPRPVSSPAVVIEGISEVPVDFLKIMPYY